MDISSDNIKIHLFMVQDLKLSGDELIIYAMVYGFHEKDAEMILNFDELSTWLSISEGLVSGILWQLTSRGLIIANEREINGEELITLDIL
jgi:hypothetical protein